MEEDQRVTRAATTTRLVQTAAERLSCNLPSNLRRNSTELFVGPAIFLSNAPLRATRVTRACV